MSALRSAFAAAKADDRAALIGYLPAGFPDTASCIEAIRAIVASGVNIVEVGVPYSDPLLDGPVIQDAVEHALHGGTTMHEVLLTVQAVADAGAVALVMSYWNPVEQYGIDRFARDLAAAGGAGVITPDLTPEEARGWIGTSAAEHLDRIFLVAPSSSDERLAIVAASCTGFVYAASLMGVTGARRALSAGASALVTRTRAVTDLPIAVGLGVSTAAQAHEIAQYADGVIVGSALVAALGAGGPPAAGELAGDLAAGVRKH